MVVVDEVKWLSERVKTCTQQDFYDAEGVLLSEDCCPVAFVKLQTFANDCVQCYSPRSLLDSMLLTLLLTQVCALYI